MKRRKEESISLKLVPENPLQDYKSGKRSDVTACLRTCLAVVNPRRWKEVVSEGGQWATG